MRIGRGQGCDVRLPDPSVSPRHATVRASGSEFALVDEKSTNGTFVGAARLVPGTPRPLKNGDMIRVGKVWLEVRIDQTPATRDLAVATRDLALALVSQAMRSMGQVADVSVRVVAGPDAGASLCLEDEGRVYVVGGDAGADLPLGDAGAAPAHVSLTRRGGTILVRDAGSKNGAWLGDARVPLDRDVVWRAGGPLRIGGTEMVLDEPAASALAELEAAEDEPMGPDDVPEAPPPVNGPRASEAPADEAGPPLLVAPRPSPAPSASAAAWSAVDVGIVVAAVAILALSLAGLYWLLHS